MLGYEGLDQPLGTGAWAGRALMRASARAQYWFETARAYRRAYTVSRHFRRLAS
jgi:hypothetical protein